jgi:hypothetical protein
MSSSDGRSAHEQACASNSAVMPAGAQSCGARVPGDRSTSSVVELDPEKSGRN